MSKLEKKVIIQSLKTEGNTIGLQLGFEDVILKNSVSEIPVKEFEEMDKKLIEQKQDELLSSIGLSRRMVWQEPDHMTIYDESAFRPYVTQEYKSSERAEMDEHYRMAEFNLIHIATGIRICFLTSESFFGDTVDYIVKDVFIKTKDQKQFTLIGIDLIQKVFLTEDGKQIHFSDINMSTY